MHNYVQLCTIINNYVQLCTIMYNYAQLCTIMYTYAQIIQKLLQKFDIVLSREPIIKRRIELTPADNKMFFNIKDI